MLKLLNHGNEGKKDNKGFSLVELIVVIAIMAIMAVAITPRLTHYIDKARKSNDNQIVDAISTTVQLSLVDQDIWKEVKEGDTAIVGKVIPLLTYDTTNKVYKFDNSTIPAKLLAELESVVSKDGFKFESEDANSKKTDISTSGSEVYGAQIYLIISDNYSYSLYLVYGMDVSSGSSAQISNYATFNPATVPAVSATIITALEAEASYSIKK